MFFPLFILGHLAIAIAVWIAIALAFSIWKRNCVFDLWSDVVRWNIQSSKFQFSNLVTNTKFENRKLFGKITKTTTKWQTNKKSWKQITQKNEKQNPWKRKWQKSKKKKKNTWTTKHEKRWRKLKITKNENDEEWKCTKKSKKWTFKTMT